MQSTSNNNNISSFSTTVQKKLWSFKSQDEINQIRQATYKDAIQRIIQSSLPIDELISAEEARMIILYYQTLLEQSYGKTLGLRDKVQATALVFLQRFFSVRSVLFYDPQDIVMTCIYLSCKVEENHMDVDYLSNMLKFPNKDAILKYELDLLEALNFNINLYHPYRSLYGFVAHMQALQLVTSNSAEVLHKLWEKAHTILDTSMHTDAHFLYSPSQIALAALKLAATDETLKCTALVNTYIEQQFKTNPLYDKLMQQIAVIQKLITTPINFPTQLQITPIQQKLKAIHEKVKLLEPTEEFMNDD